MDDIRCNSLTRFVNDVITTTAELSQPRTLQYSLRGYAITNNRQMLANSYAQEGLFQIVVDQPVDDALRGGIDVSSPELQQSDIDELLYYLDDNNVLLDLGQAFKWARLFGGGGLIINAGQNTTRPFDVERINEKTPLEFYDVDRWELAAPLSGNPMDQYLPQFMVGKPFNYYGREVHQSHVCVFKGKKPPSLLRGHYMGWGMSEVERLVRSLNMSMKHSNVVFELLDEAKIDTFGIRGLNSALATNEGASRVSQRVALAAKLKNFQNALVHDAEDTYAQKTLSFSGLSEIVEQIRINLASDCRMPLTKLFGITPSGLGNNDDIENYNSMIETEIRSKMRGAIRRVLLICCRKVFGYAPKHIKFNFQPLRELTVNQQSEIQTQRLNRILAAFQNGIISSRAAAEQINSEQIFRQPISTDEALDLEELQEIRGNKPAPTTPGYGAGTSVVTT